VLRLSRLKLLVLTTAIALASLAGASVALATSDSGSQNPNLTVTASLSPDQAVTGTTVTAAASETNNTAARDGVKVTYTLTYPDGRVFTSSKQLNLSASQTQEQSRTYIVDGTDPRGTYTYTVTASDKVGASSATASIVVN
jgi:hypothetical protein